MIDRNFYFQLHENAKAFPYVCRKGAMTNLVAWMRGIRPCKPRVLFSFTYSLPSLLPLLAPRTDDRSFPCVFGWPDLVGSVPLRVKTSGTRATKPSDPFPGQKALPEMFESSNKVEMGSAAWMGANEYEDDLEFHQRATNFLGNVKWDHLTAICSEQREECPVTLQRSFRLAISTRYGRW